MWERHKLPSTSSAELYLLKRLRYSLSSFQQFKKVLKVLSPSCSPAGCPASPSAPVASSPSALATMRRPLVSHVYPSRGCCHCALRQIVALPPRGSVASLVWGCCFHGDPAGCYSAHCQHMSDGWPPQRDASVKCRGVKHPVRSLRTEWAWPWAPESSLFGPGWSPSAGQGSP